MFLGIDIGSSSSKAALMDNDGKLLGTKVVNIGTGTNGIEIALSKLLKEQGCTEEDILYTVATGYGRMTYKKANAQITEISCHAKGVVSIYPQTRSIIDIGGQDAKAIRLNDKGRVDNFVMNEKCAAGTGRFFEVMARVLNCSLDELATLAAKAQNTVPISSVCTVFAESEVISQLAGGAKPEDVAKGAHQSVAKRVTGLCSRLGMVPQVVMTGGVALNASMVQAMAEEIKLDILVPENPQVMGAIGAADYAREKYLSNILKLDKTK